MVWSATKQWTSKIDAAQMTVVWDSSLMKQASLAAPTGLNSTAQVETLGGVSPDDFEMHPMNLDLSGKV